MTKKGYQKRLPTVLVPTQRPAPEQERLSNQDARPEPQPSPVPAPPAEPVPREECRDAPARPVRSTTDRIGAAVVVGLLAVLVVAIGLTSVLSGDAPSTPPGRATAFASRPPVAIAAGESYVALRVMTNGDVEATHWIAAARPLEWLRLELPELVGTEEVTATALVVRADGEVVPGPDRVASGAAVYLLDSATGVEVRYRLTGAAALSDSVPGRALAAAGMEVRYEPRSRRETRVVRAPGLLSLACGDPVPEGLLPCGGETGPDEWSVDLDGRRVGDSLVVQLDLG